MKLMRELIHICLKARALTQTTILYSSPETIPKGFLTREVCPITIFSALGCASLSIDCSVVLQLIFLAKDGCFEITCYLFFFFYIFSITHSTLDPVKVFCLIFKGL